MTINTNLKVLTLIALFAFAISSCKKDGDDPTETTPPPNLQETEKDIFLTPEHLGVCYGPYHYDNQAPGKPISDAQMKADLTQIAANFDFFRTYTVADSMYKVVDIATAKGLQMALGVHVYPGDGEATKSDIDLAIKKAKEHPSTVMCIVIGNETNHHGTNHVPPATVASYMDYAKAQMTAADLKVPLSACITSVGADEKNSYPDDDYCGVILQKCKDLNHVDHQLIFLTIYPYFGGGEPDDISGNMQWSYNNGISNAEKNFGLGVVIGEIGWPSGTQNNGTTTDRENPANAGINFNASLKWVDGNNFLNKAYNSFWFEMFDEPWKTNEPNGVGPSWGIYEKNGAATPKFSIPDLH